MLRCFRTVCLLLAFVDISLCAVISVDPSLGFKASIFSASKGDTVQIPPGIYTGPLNCGAVVDKDGVTIVSLKGPLETIFSCPRSRCLVVAANNVVVSGLTFQDGMSWSENSAAMRHMPSKIIPLRVQKPSYPRRRAGRVVLATVTLFSVSESDDIFVSKSLPASETRSRVSRQAEKRSGLAGSILTSSVGGCVLVFDVVAFSLQNSFLSNCQAERGAGIAVLDTTSVCVF